MSNDNVIGDEAAKAELERIIDFFEVDTSEEGWEDTKDKLLRVIAKGRLTLDEDKGTLTLGLVRPIGKESGEDITELVFKEPNALDLKVLDKYKENEKMAKTVHLASRITGQPIGIIDRMGSRDLASMGAVTALFF